VPSVREAVFRSWSNEQKVVALEGAGCARRLGRQVEAVRAPEPAAPAARPPTAALAPALALAPRRLATLAAARMETPLPPDRWQASSFIRRGAYAAEGSQIKQKTLSLPEITPAEPAEVLPPRQLPPAFG
jgi:hypothetical protein